MFVGLLPVEPEFCRRLMAYSPGPDGAVKAMELPFDDMRFEAGFG